MNGSRIRYYGALRAAGLPEAEYDRILKNFEDTIELYLQARGIDPEGK